ncbi:MULTISPECIES: AAA family ATPase [Haloarcula]|uniref:Replication factor C small subunit n=1 Tax=Haloarcula pellucida TaxID=1427151 RepID=A0A830GS50_9EURY|nr:MULTISPECIES: AAA family ATPase [Halomicroarcula]MBX0349599.1 AAA family ATPase [Halomicroarcula pellucida]MDS0278817.1 AAA family ATPase [Halomicroarcula sp. S1AR25-4]GGO02184.1 ATPase AAA [Halomicroarcula pellucida]
MDAPLWTETHAPALEEIPQQKAREHLQGAVEEPMNLLVHGPKGAGKTAGVRAFAETVHDNPDADFTELNVADVFDMTKKEVANDPRFASFIDSKRRRESSKADLINHVLKESASYTPMSGTYKTILLDNAEGMREDFQQALRRVMEQYYEATQFVIATRQPSALIPPIRSRCFPVVMRAPTHEETVSVLRDVVTAEDADHDDDGLEYVAGYAEGDLRQAILATQTTYEEAGEVTMETAYEVLADVEADDAVADMVEAAEEGRFSDARSTLDDLLVDEGYGADDVLEELLGVARSRYSGQRLAEVHRLAGETDMALTDAANERIHLSRLLAQLQT